MANELNIEVNATQNVDKELGNVQDASVRTERVIVQSMGNSEQAFDSAARQSGKMGAALDQLSGAGSQLAGGIGDAADGIEGLKNLQSAGAQRASEQARKLLDVDQAMEDTKQAAEDLKQAQLDLNQSQLDSKQAGIDVEQAQNDATQSLIDAETAQTAYNDAVKQYGPNSTEAKQAAQDLKQAQTDLKQANLDSEQATADKAQADSDGSQAMRDMSQAAIDAKGSQQDLTDAQRAAKPPTELQAWGQQMQLITPVIMGVVGMVDLLIIANNALSASWIKNTAAMVMSKIATAAQAVATGIATAAQWLWNLAMTANPIGIIIVAIGALIAIIIYIATQTTWFQQLWNAIWGAIGEPVKAVANLIMDYWKFLWNVLIAGVQLWWNTFTGFWKGAADFAVSAFNVILDLPGKIGSAFQSVGNVIYAPFKWAFNMVAWAWNNTVGRLRWDVPDWVPGIGGGSISAPRLPSLARGGDIIRDGAAYVHKGERIVPASTAGSPAGGQGDGTGRQLTVAFTGNTDTAFASMFMKLVRTGKIQVVTA
jgi:hypothetical protein